MINEKEIYHILRELIFNAEIPPGQKLREGTLAEAFHVSRTPIRSVLQRLKFDSLVELIPQKGAFVYCPSEEEARQIAFVRGILEPEAAGLAAKNATESQIDEMYRLVDEETVLYNAHKVNQALVITNHLHMKMIEASANKYLIECLKKVISLSHVILAFYDVSDSKKHKAEEEHLPMVDAIGSRNSLLAKELMRQHIPSITKDVDFSKAYTRSDSLSLVIDKYIAEREQL